MNWLKFEGCEILKPEKKENLAAKQKYTVIVRRNKQINKVNIVILAVGLLLTFSNYEDIGGQIILLGVIILSYTLGSNFIARAGMRKRK
ncbi:MAG TPA: hypothetical protein C5S50_03520 [Methanosarcinaceae archaeon]|nr:hypothetical protein [Methanosarcinaceae archaeon]